MTIGYASDVIHMYRQLNKASRDYCRTFKSKNRSLQISVRTGLIEREYYEQQLEEFYNGYRGHRFGDRD